MTYYWVQVSKPTSITFWGTTQSMMPLSRLKNDDFPEGINSVVFLLHKPVGLGSKKNVLSPGDPRVAELYAQIDRGRRRFKVGMDSCCVPGIVNFCHNVIPEAIEPCEGGRFSCYIGPDMVMLPCSFDQPKQYGVSLREHTLEQAWNSQPFDQFRGSSSDPMPRMRQAGKLHGRMPAGA